MRRVDKLMAPLFHGGVPGLSIGDLLEPGHSRDNHHPGCPHCAARARGESLDGADPPTMHVNRVYLTSDRQYARYYASLWGRGDLYLVEPIGEVTRSEEDPFPAFLAEAARVVAVPERGILLRMGERRKLYLRWARADGIPRAVAEEEFDDMIRGLVR